MNYPQNEPIYPLDPETNFFIVSPRLYALRRLQAMNENVNLLHLRLEQRGLAPVTYMHHVSKIVEAKVESYRVRICRTCSGLSNLLELGSYTDVESALLINDAHELMQGRFKNLHLLCRDDFNYLHHLTVRKRGSLSDQPLLQVLRERIMKNTSNEQNKGKRILALANERDDPMTSAISSYQASFYNSPTLPLSRTLSNDHVSNNDSGKSSVKSSLSPARISSNVASRHSYDQDPDDLSKASKESDESDGAMLTNDSSSFRNSDPTLLQTMESVKKSRPQSATTLDPSAFTMPYAAASQQRNSVHRNMPSKSKSIPQKQTPDMQLANEAMAANVSAASLSRKMLNYEQFKSNLLSLRTELLFWSYCSNLSEVENFHDLLSLSLYPVSNNMVSSHQFRRYLQDISIPTPMVYSLISSLYPGDSHEIAEVLQFLSSSLSIESLPLMRFLDMVATASTVITDFKSYLEILQSAPSNDISTESIHLIESDASQGASSSTSPTIAAATVGASGIAAASTLNSSRKNDFKIEKFPQEKFSTFVKLIRMFRTMTCYYEYCMRLCSWEQNVIDKGGRNAQDCELRLLGIHGQTEARLIAVLPMASALKEIMTMMKSMSSETSNFNAKDGTSDDKPKSNGLDPSYYQLIEDTYSTMLTSLIHSLLAFSTISIVIGKVFGMGLKIHICLNYFNEYLPIIRATVGDRLVYQLFLQAHLDLLLTSLLMANDESPTMKLSHMISYPNFSSTSSPSDNLSSYPILHSSKSSEWRLLAFALGVDFVKQTKHHYWNVPYSIQGSEAIIFFESAFRSYVTIFQLVILLDESDFLSSCNLDALKLLNAISTSLQGFSEWIQKQGCSIYGSHTLLSLQTVIETSLTAAYSFMAKYSAAISILHHIIRMSRNLLASASNRFLLSKVLLDHLIFTEEQRYAKLTASNREGSLLDKQRHILFPISENSLTTEIYPTYPSTGTTVNTSMTNPAVNIHNPSNRYMNYPYFGSNLSNETFQGRDNRMETKFYHITPSNVLSSSYMQSLSQQLSQPLSQQMPNDDDTRLFPFSVVEGITPLPKLGLLSSDIDADPTYPLRFSNARNTNKIVNQSMGKGNSNQTMTVSSDLDGLNDGNGLNPTNSTTGTSFEMKSESNKNDMGMNLPSRTSSADSILGNDQKRRKLNESIPIPSLQLPTKNQSNIMSDTSSSNSLSDQPSK